jgi:TolB-like protein
LAVLTCLGGCAAKNEPVAEMSADRPAGGKGLSIAVLPVFNLSGAPAPLKEIRKLLLDDFQQRRFNIIDAGKVDKVIDRYRLRYVGSLNEDTARAFREEARAETVLVTSLELYNDMPPPKISLTARLVSTGPRPQILWIDGFGMAGDDDIGLLELSLVEDPRLLLHMAMQRLAASLDNFLSGRPERVGSQKAKGKFRPKILFRSPGLVPDKKYTVAVIPFFNLSERKNAGDIMALHFVRHLAAVDNFAVIEPGIVRQALLRLRIIMDDGISLGYADILFRRLNADLVLAGKVLDYQDYQGLNGTPKVDFSAQLIERRSREIIWKANSFNTGDDGVFFFDWGRVNTAHAMASQMVQLAVADMVE